VAGGYILVGRHAGITAGFRIRERSSSRMATSLSKVLSLKLPWWWILVDTTKYVICHTGANVMIDILFISTFLAISTIFSKMAIVRFKCNAMIIFVLF
jgi:hypothetical protein